MAMYFSLLASLESSVSRNAWMSGPSTSPNGSWLSLDAAMMLMRDRSGWVFCFFAVNSSSYFLSAPATRNLLAARFAACPATTRAKSGSRFLATHFRSRKCSASF